MPPLSSSLLDEPRTISNEKIEIITKQFSNVVQDLGLEIHSFKIKWYNDLVAPEYYLNYNEDSLAFVVISAPMMFENAFLPFLANVLNPAVFESNNKYFDPIDECMQHYFNILQKKLILIADSLVEKIHDFELLMPYRRPKILLQTAAHVSGAAYYYKLIDRDKHRLGVCVHPQYGGWFGIRGAFVLRNLLAVDLAPKLPPNIVSEDKQTLLLKLFNEQWQDWSYRDIIPVKCRYSSLQRQYFSLKPRDRVFFIKTEIIPILHKYLQTNILSNNLSL